MSLSIGTTYEGRRPEYISQLLPHVDHIEIAPDTIAQRSDGSTHINPSILNELKAINQKKSILIHGVGLSIGSYDGYSRPYIQLLDELINQLDVKWHSEHLAYTMVNGEHIGSMLTLPKTVEVVDMVCRRIDEIQERYKIPFLLENVITMLPPPDSTFTDAAFLNAITSKTGCGLILDVYNLECDQYNFRFNIDEFLSELNTDAVCELHLAGGVIDRVYDFMMDIHAMRVQPSTWLLLNKVMTHPMKNLEAVTYEILDEFIDRLGSEEIIEELKKVNHYFTSSYATEPASAGTA